MFCASITKYGCKACAMRLSSFISHHLHQDASLLPFLFSFSVFVEQSETHASNAKWRSTGCRVAPSLVMTPSPFSSSLAPSHNTPADPPWLPSAIGPQGRGAHPSNHGSRNKSQNRISTTSLFCRLFCHHTSSPNTKHATMVPASTSPNIRPYPKHP